MSRPAPHTCMPNSEVLLNRGSTTYKEYSIQKSRSCGYRLFLGYFMAGSCGHRVSLRDFMAGSCGYR
eukprot:11093275-Karenia_brevis.AAC.1